MDSQTEQLQKSEDVLALQNSVNKKLVKRVMKRIKQAEQLMKEKARERSQEVSGGRQR